MTYQLIEKAFEKAGTESGKDSVNGKAEHLSEYLLAEFKFSVSIKSLTRYFKKETTPNQQVRNYLAQFLGYENYKNFVLKNSPGFVANAEPDPLKKKESNFKRIGLFSLLILSVTVISAYVGFKNGAARVWYDKSNNKPEFFTAPGIHPINGKTLKPVTRYIPTKYVRD